MKVVLDMNLSPGWRGALADAGIAATHWSEVGDATALDQDIMDYARAANAVVLTQDLDFGAILAATRQTKPSVVQLRAEALSPAAHAKTVVAALLTFAEELAQGALITVEPSRVRLTLLPLNR